MAHMQTKCFGEVEYLENSVFEFPLGLPGFENEKQFVFIDRADMKPLVFLQSVVTPGLCFILLPILAVDAQYRLTLDDDQLLVLQMAPGRQPLIGDDVFCGAILRAADGEEGCPTANLLAPVVVNFRQQVGIQAIQNGTRYSHCHPLQVGEEVGTC